MTLHIILWLVLFASAFSLLGVVYARQQQDSLEHYIVARNTQSTVATMLTLVATSLGAWILFAPAQAATWGGLAAVIGYALGALAPRVLMIPLGRSMRTLIPEGHTLSEYVLARYGRGMYVLSMLIMVFYLFIAITAEITAIAKLITLLAPVPLWVTALIVLVATLVYTAYGGLRASIFTDKIQVFIIIPLLLALCIFGWQATGGFGVFFESLQLNAPELLRLDDGSGVKAGLTFFIAILLTGLFHQGNWQRVYAAQTDRAMHKGFLLAGLAVAPIVFVMGLFGLAFVALGAGTDSSVALFSVLLPTLPTWFVVLLIPLGLALVMSSADTAINAASSLIAVELRRLRPTFSALALMRSTHLFIIVLSFLVWIFAAQGYSVLYLFLFADLLCSAAAFPVFLGLFSQRYSGQMACISTFVGLLGGLMLFPLPHQPLEFLLESFLLAALLPIVVSILLLWLWPNQRDYDFNQLKKLIRGIDKANF